jgi:putative endonuclease
VGRENLDFGKAAESAAVEFLKTKGYKIPKRNYKNNFGEIDIIARQSGVICFLEVKATRRRLNLGTQQEAVTGAKQRQISRVAVDYLKSNNLLGKPARFDVVALLYEKDLPEISLIKDAFELNPDLTI